MQLNEAVQRERKALLALLLLFGLSLLALQVFGTPAAPQITHISNETSVATGTGRLINESGHTGGRIITMNLDAVQQNIHWKAYVGNVSGAYALEDASGYSIYEWAVASFTGEVYVTRIDNVSWTGVVCANATHVEQEMTEFNHSYIYNADDNINETFYLAANHSPFSVGDLQFVAAQCNYSINTYVNDSPQTTTGFFDEILLFDNATKNLVYVTLMENSAWGYRNDSRQYDYQIMLPENASPGLAATATPYYFFVELL